MQLRSRAKAIAAEARAKDDTQLAASFGQLGETFVQGQGLLTTPPWTWGTRR